MKIVKRKTQSVPTMDCSECSLRVRLNGVNRPTSDKGRKKLPTTDRKKINRLPTLSIFVFRKKRPEEHFFIFLTYEVTSLKITIEFPVKVGFTNAN